MNEGQTNSCPMTERQVLLTFGPTQGTQHRGVMLAVCDRETNQTYLRMELSHEELGKLLTGVLRMPVDAVVPEVVRAVVGVQE